MMKNANQATLQWDAAEGATSYRIYIRPISGGEETLVGDTTDLQFTLTFTEDTAVIAGVQSVKTAVIDGVTDPVEEASVISWSDDPAACAD
ncbi:MAG: hypothetical protein WDA09_08175, partial [Bacteriovoracaceae bacterium]